ncbi:MAG: translation initiation factor IF-2 N-terminal domain-containing protein, partial [Granulicella sp.]
MSKVRINDLARELEVKSRPILDALEAIGVSGKTHSSSIEADQAERVREYFKGGGRSAPTPRQAEPKPRFDLSHISKPGDAVKAILERKQAEASGTRAVPPRAVAAPPQAVAAAPPAKAATPVVVAAAAAPPAVTPRRIVPLPRQHAHIVAPPPPPPAIASKPPVGPVIAKPPIAAATHAAAERPVVAAAHPLVVAAPPKPAVVAAPPAAVAPATHAPTSPTVPTAPTAVDVEAAAATPAHAGAPAEPAEVAPPPPPGPPARRVIMPQTGPRPIYTAPPVAPGTPARGRPIFERPRPGAAPGTPGYRPGAPGAPGTAPGARRPMHPTRTFPGGPGGAPGSVPGRPGFTPGARPAFGARPGFGARPAGAPGVMPGPGENPSGMRPAARPGQRRGGQRYEKSKEGPMKGFQPPPRYGGQQISREPLPITKTITVTEGISVKDLAEKLDVRGKDLIATLLMKGVFVTVNQSLEGELVKDVARQFGADAQVISVEEQLENEAIEGFLEDTTGMVEITR